LAEGVVGLLDPPVKPTGPPDAYRTLYTAQVLRDFGGDEWETWNQGPLIDGKRTGGMRDTLVKLQVKANGENYGELEPGRRVHRPVCRPRGDDGDVHSHAGGVLPLPAAGAGQPEAMTAALPRSATPAPGGPGLSFAHGEPQAAHPIAPHLSAPAKPYPSSVAQSATPARLVNPANPRQPMYRTDTEVSGGQDDLGRQHGGEPCGGSGGGGRGQS